MTAATMGTPVTSANPNTQANTSLAVTLATTTAGQLNIIEISGDVPGAGVNPTMTTPAGWTKAGEVIDTNAGTATSCSFQATYYRAYQSGDGTSVTISWVTAGQMVAVCTPWSGQDATTPIPYWFGQIKTPTDANYLVADTTGTDQGYLCTGFANRGTTAWSAVPDNARGSVAVACTMTCRVTAAEVAPSTAYSKNAVGTNTSVGVAWAYVVKGASGSSYAGTTSMTSVSSLASVANLTESMSAAMSSTTSMSASTGIPGAASMASVSSFGSDATRSTAASASMTSVSSMTATPSVTAAVNWVQTTSPMWVAHRGGFATTLGEETLEAYTAAANQLSTAALEISVWKCSTGEYVCSHDQTTGRVFSGTSLDIPSNTWTTLSTKTSINGGKAIRRMTDIIDAFPGRIFVIDNKQDTGAAALIAVLDVHCPGRWIGKQYYTAAGTWLTACQNDGAPVWGYFYPTDLGNLSTALASLSVAKSPVIFGLGDYSTGGAPVQSDANTFFTFTAANSVKTWAHILATSTQRSTADGQATTAGHPFDGYMTQGFAATAPTDANTVAMTSVSSFGSAAVRSQPASATMSSVSSAGATASVSTAVAASMTSSTALAGSATETIATGATMTSVTSLAAAGTTGASVTMTSTTALFAAYALQVPSSVSMGSVTSLTSGATLNRPASAAMASVSAFTGQLSGTGQSTASMTSVTAFNGTALAYLAAAAAMQSVSALSASATVPGAGRDITVTATLTYTSRWQAAISPRRYAATLEGT